MCWSSQVDLSVPSIFCFLIGEVVICFYNLLASQLLILQMSLLFRECILVLIIERQIRQAATGDSKLQRLARPTRFCHIPSLSNNNPLVC